MIPLGLHDCMDDVLPCIYVSIKVQYMYNIWYWYHLTRYVFRFVPINVYLFCYRHLYIAPISEHQMSINNRFILEEVWHVFREINKMEAFSTSFHVFGQRQNIQPFRLSQHITIMMMKRNWRYFTMQPWRVVGWHVVLFLVPQLVDFSGNYMCMYHVPWHNSDELG